MAGPQGRPNLTLRGGGVRARKRLPRLHGRGAGILSGALNLQVGLPFENVITKDNLKVLSGYRYECNPAPRGGMFGERRFVGVFRSRPSGYATAVGLRLIGGELRVYRVARRFPYRTGDELRSLAGGVAGQYGGSVLVVNYLSSNAYTEVQARGKDGWFGRSELFNPSDPTDNAAELVIVDPQTRGLLAPYSWPMSGEIKPTQGGVPAQCGRSMPLD